MNIDSYKILFEFLGERNVETRYTGRDIEEYRNKHIFDEELPFKTLVWTGYDESALEQRLVQHGRVLGRYPSGVLVGFKQNGAACKRWIPWSEMFFADKQNRLPYASSGYSKYDRG